MGTPDINWYTGVIAASPKAMKFVISNADELAGLAEIVNANKDNFAGKTITLIGNIDLSQYDNWVPIGSYADDHNKKFSGTFDGAGHVISKLTINCALGYKGLFGYICGGKVKNLGLNDARISGGEDVGSVAGSVGNYSSLTNCYSTGEVSGTNKVGGIAGNVTNNSTITGCYSTCVVSGTNKIGGIVGAASYSDIVKCAALSPEVKGAGVFGRVAGSIDSSQAVSKNVAYAGMTKKDGGTNWSRKGAADGADITAAEIRADGTIKGLFSAAADWAVEPGSLPGFRGEPVPMPAYI